MNFRRFFCLFVPISWLLKVLCGVFDLSDVPERCFDEQAFCSTSTHKQGRTCRTNVRGTWNVRPLTAGGSNVYISTGGVMVTWHKDTFKLYRTRKLDLNCWFQNNTKKKPLKMLLWKSLVGLKAKCILLINVECNLNVFTVETPWGTFKQSSTERHLTSVPFR